MLAIDTVECCITCASHPFENIYTRQSISTAQRGNGTPNGTRYTLIQICSFGAACLAPLTPSLDLAVHVSVCHESAVRMRRSLFRLSLFRLPNASPQPQHCTDRPCCQPFKKGPHLQLTHFPMYWLVTQLLHSSRALIWPFRAGETFGQGPDHLRCAWMAESNTNAREQRQ